MTGSLRSVDDVEFLQRKIEASSQLLDLFLQNSIFERTVLVEKWRDELGINVHHDEHEDGNERPSVQIKVVSEKFDDPDDHAHYCRVERDPDCKKLFQLVGQPEFNCHIVESVLLFQDEIGVVSPWKTDH